MIEFSTHPRLVHIWVCLKDNIMSLPNKAGYSSNKPMISAQRHASNYNCNTGDNHLSLTQSNKDFLPLG
jgi:hypothetical protein